MNHLLISGKIESVSEIKLSRAGTPYVQARLSINSRKSVIRLVALGASLCDKIALYARKGRETFVIGRVYSKDKESESISVWVDEVAFIGYKENDDPQTTAGVYEEKQRELEEAIEVDDSVL